MSEEGLYDGGFGGSEGRVRVYIIVKERGVLALADL